MLHESRCGERPWWCCDYRHGLPWAFVALNFAQVLAGPAESSLSATNKLNTIDHALVGTSRQRFLLGINYPWLNYGHDFGQAVWPEGAWMHDGVSAPDSQRRVDADFAYLHSKGVGIVRWFMFADGRASPEFDGKGFVTGLDDHFNDDLDTALSLACKHDLHVILVLLDFYWLMKPELSGGVRRGGHTDVITDIRKRQSFFKNALLPVMKTYGKDRRIFAWEVINQPEWAIEEVTGGGDHLVNVRIDDMQSFVREAVELIHQNAIQKVTLGTARGRWLPYWQDMKLDLYEFHHYGEPGNFPPFVPYANTKLDKPAILGEFPTKGGDITSTRYLSITLENGYAGALGWSLHSHDDYSDFTPPATANKFEQWSQSNGLAPAAECK